MMTNHWLLLKLKSLNEIFSNFLGWVSLFPPIILFITLSIVISNIHEAWLEVVINLCWPEASQHWLDPQIEFPPTAVTTFPTKVTLKCDLRLGIPTLEMVGRRNVLGYKRPSNLIYPYPFLRKPDDKLRSVCTIQMQGRMNWILYIHWRKGELWWIFHQHQIDIHRLSPGQENRLIYDQF